MSRIYVIWGYKFEANHSNQQFESVSVLKFGFDNTIVPHKQKFALAANLTGRERDFTSQIKILQRDVKTKAEIPSGNVSR